MRKFQIFLFALASISSLTPLRRAAEITVDWTRYHNFAETLQERCSGSIELKERYA